MKQLFIVTAILMASLVGYSQVKKDTTSKGKGETADNNLIHPAYNDSTGIIQARDLQELINLIQDYPAKYANPITSWLQERFQLRVKQYMAKPH